MEVERRKKDSRNCRVISLKFGISVSGMASFSACRGSCGLMSGGITF